MRSQRRLRRIYVRLQRLRRKYELCCRRLDEVQSIPFLFHLERWPIRYPNTRPWREYRHRRMRQLSPSRQRAVGIVEFLEYHSDWYQRSHWLAASTKPVLSHPSHKQYYPIRPMRRSCDLYPRLSVAGSWSFPMRPSTTPGYFHPRRNLHNPRQPGLVRDENRWVLNHCVAGYLAEVRQRPGLVLE